MCGRLSSPPDQLLTAVLPLLLQNTKDKNTAAKVAAETAVVDLVCGEEGLKVRYEGRGGVIVSGILYVVCVCM